MLSSSKKDNSSFWAQYAYLFLVDIDRIVKWKESYEDYEKREPGYAYACLQAYNYAFSTPLNRGSITEDLIKTIHQYATRHFKEKEKTAGKYKTVSTNFTICINDDNYLTLPNATIEGFWEFVNVWLERNNSTHLLTFSNPLNNKEVCHLLVHPDLRYLSLMTDNGMEKFSKEKHQKLIEKMLNQTSQNQIKCEVHCLAEEEVITISPAEKIKEILIDYNTQIISANTNQEKLKIIIKTIQLIEQLHLFTDGNCRTCYILLNRLLHENNLPLTIVDDMNKFDMYPISTLVTMVQQGQERFLQLANENIPLSLEAVNLPYKEDLSAFYQHVIAANRTNSLPIEKSYNKNFGLFEKTEIIKEKTIQALNQELIEITKNLKEEEYNKLNNSLQEKKYEVLLRVAACVPSAISIVELLLANVTVLNLNVSAISMTGKTALDLAKDKGNLHAEELLKNYLYKNEPLSFGR